MDNIKIGIKRVHSYWKNEDVSGWKAQINHKNTQKLNWYILTITQVFVNQKKIKVCEYTVKMAPMSLSHGTIFTMCWHTFTLFWLTKISVIVETFQLNFHEFVCAFHPEISSFFRYELPLSFPIFVLSINIYSNLYPVYAPEVRLNLGYNSLPFTFSCSCMAWKSMHAASYSKDQDSEGSHLPGVSKARSAAAITHYIILVTKSLFITVI